MIGSPGTIAALRQQSGRSGRSGKDSLALLVASPNPMDQFLMKHPDYLFDKSPEDMSCGGQGLVCDNNQDATDIGSDSKEEPSSMI